MMATKIIHRGGGLATSSRLLSTVVPKKAKISTDSHLWSRAKAIPAKYPFAFGVFVSGIKNSICDLVVQKVVNQNEKIDWRRNAAFATFGFIYLGGVQYVLYVPVMSRIFPNASKFVEKPLKEKLKDIPGLINVGLQVFLDQVIHHPLMYFPAFYIVKEIVTSGGEDGRKPDFNRVVTIYRNNIKEDMIALWKIWVPATLFNFAIMPMHMRIPFTATISMLWTSVLSSMRGGDVVHGEDVVGGAVTGSSYQIFIEGLDAFNTSPVEMDTNLDHVSISAASKDRPGLVAQLANHIASQGGNVTHSKMVRLGEEFIIQMHVALPKDKSASFSNSLKSKELKNLDIHETRLNRRKTSDKTKAVMGIKIHCVGYDRPGILAELTDRIAIKGMSLEEISTSIRLNSAGQREFVIDLKASSPNIKDKENLDQCIADITLMEKDLQLTHLDIRVYTD